MASEWAIQPLHHVARELTVGYVGTMADQYVADGVLFLRSLNIRPFGLDLSDVKYVSPEFHATIKKSELQEGDVVIVRTGRPGTCAVIPGGLGQVNCSDLVIVRCGPKLRPHFLCYWVNAMAGHHVRAHAVGAVQQHFNVGSAKLIELPIPPLKDQDLVLGVLRSLDDRIDNLRQTNATLEAIAQALFKSWFVDFDPVRAKAEGREPEGMDAATAALFPSEYEDSELGSIPKGWSVARFDQEFDFTMGQSPPGSTCSVGGSGMAFFQGCTDFGDVYPSERVFCTQPARFAHAGDLLMSVRAPVGALNIANGDCSIGRGLSAIRHKCGSTSLTREFLKSSMSRIESAAGEGALFKSLSKQQLASLPVLVPPGALMKAIATLLDPLTARGISAAKQADELTDLRDTILPRLISGKLRLPEVTQEVEAYLA